MNIIRKPFHFRRHFLLVAIAIALCLPFSPAYAIIDAALQMQLGNPSGATADPYNHQHYLIQRSVEAMDYSDDLGMANWVSWDLTSGDVGDVGRGDFATDYTLPAGFYRVTDNDYSGSGYDRGHMCPSADRTDTREHNDLVFYMSNIMPQRPDNNQGVWANFETYCRDLADGGNELLITCGGSGFTGARIQPSQAVAIPSYTWKIAVVVPLGPSNALYRINESTRVIALKIPNSNGVSSIWQNFVTSANQIEVDTGFTFFTALPTNVATVLRSKVDGQTTPAPLIFGFSPPSGAINSSVIITGTNFTAASAVTFNSIPASFTINSVTQITAIVPTNATSGAISVTGPGGTAVSTNTFSVTGSTIDLAITKSHTGNFTQGDIAGTYVITVQNAGSQPTTGTVTVTDLLPAGLTATAMNGFGWTTDLPNRTCTRSDSLAGGAGYPAIFVTVSVATNAPASVTNVATVSGGGDVNPANNTALDPTTILVSGGGGETITLLAWNVSGLSGGNNNFGPSPFAPTTKAADLASLGLIRGSGVGTSGTAAARAWGGNAWTATTAAGAVTANEFVTVTSVVASGYTVSYTAISKFDYRRSSTGPANGLLQYRVGSGTFVDVSALAYPVNSSDGASLNPINLSGIAALQNVGAGTNVTFRIVNYGGGSEGTWYIFDVASSTAADFTIQGSITPVSYLTPIESWRLAWFGTTNNSGIAADTAVVTSDGMPNLLKYVLGLNPLIPTNSPIVGDISTGYLRLTVPRNPEATDVTLRAVSNGDLAASWTTNGIVIDQHTPTLFQAHDTTPAGAASERFMRLEVMPAP